MRNINNYLIGSLAFIIVALVLALANADVRRAVADELKDVRVINTEAMPAKVRDVDNPSRQPVHFSEPYTVPAGKRLVIEYISFQFKTTGLCDGITAALLYGSNNVLHQYRPEFFGSFHGGPATSFYIYGLSQETRAYIGQNETVTLQSWSVLGCSPDLDHLGITGYLVDL
jgi:hypothetical protein